MMAVLTLCLNIGVRCPSRKECEYMFSTNFRDFSHSLPSPVLRTSA